MKVQFKIDKTEAETNSFKPFRTEYVPAYLYVEMDVDDAFFTPESHLPDARTQVLTEDGMSHVLARIAKMSSDAYQLTTTLGGAK